MIASIITMVFLLSTSSFLFFIVPRVKRKYTLLDGRHAGWSAALSLYSLGLILMMVFWGIFFNLFQDDPDPLLTIRSETTIVTDGQTTIAMEAM